MREAAQMLTAVEQCILRYPEQSAEIREFFLEANEWIENVFISPPEPMAEEVAITSVTEHLLGVPSFNVQLIQGSIDEDATKELLEAVSTLEFHWKGRETISKLAAQALIGAPWLFEHVSAYYSDAAREQLQAIEKQLAEYITRCLR